MAAHEGRGPAGFAWGRVNKPGFSARTPIQFHHIILEISIFGALILTFVLAALEIG